ncbi:hypothetical protein FS837_010501 [Tulasnella sp. UAMH 9824]|nr:hypothetical protein FS837_010501 [Tulasnella sp. UAMH 9824]
MQSGTFPLRRRGSHPGHGPTRSESRPALHPYQFVQPQQQSPYGPEYLPMNPPTPMFVAGGLAPPRGGAFAGAPGYAPAPPQAQAPILGYQPAAPQGHHGLARGSWPSDPAYGAPPPWWGYLPDQAPQHEESPAPSEFSATVHPLFDVDAKEQLIHELDGHKIKLPADWQSFPVTVPHPSFNPKQSRNSHTRALIAEPAIDPKVHKLRLVSPFLPWPIDVLPSHAKSPSKSPKKKDEAFVTVGDVLTAIHRALQFGITEGEYFIGSEADRERINGAYKAAMKRKERSKEEGVKRVDFLGDRTVCVGFRLPESDKEEKWIKERLVTGGEWKPEDVWILELDEPEEDEE